MNETSMTALISAFARAYHSLHNEVTVFDDSAARLLLSDEEYRQISKSMAAGIQFFAPGFTGDTEQALRWIVDNQLSPSPLGRAAFSERSLERAVQIGARQYLILGAGYDTFACRRPQWAQALEIFEIDHPATSADKRRRLKRAGITVPASVHYAQADFNDAAWPRALLDQPSFDCRKISFCALLGVTYYLSKKTFEAVLSAAAPMLPAGSTLVFDYPDERSSTKNAGTRAKKQIQLADAANEQMLAGYSYFELEQLLAGQGFLIYGHLTPPEITAQYFSAYNQAAPAHPITAFDNVNYCLAVKQ